MDRRSFIRSIAKGVLTAVATVYAPKLVEMGESVDVFDLRDPQGAKVGALTMRQREAEAFMNAMSERVAELLFYGETVCEPSEFTGLAERFEVRWQQPVMEVEYGRAPGQQELEDVYGLER